MFTHAILWKPLTILTIGGALTFAAAHAPHHPAPTTLRGMYGLKAPARLQAAHSALVLVDFQHEFLDGRLPLPNAESAVDAAATLLRWARARHLHVVHVRNEALRQDSPLFAPNSPSTRFASALTPAPAEPIVTKHLAGGFSRTDLDQQLRSRGVDTLIIAGLMTHLAVQATAADATVLGYRTIVAADAVATRPLPAASGTVWIDEPTVQRVSLAILADRVADVLPNPQLLSLPID